MWQRGGGGQGRTGRARWLEDLRELRSSQPRKKSRPLRERGGHGAGGDSASERGSALDTWWDAGPCGFDIRQPVEDEVQAA